MVRGAHFFHAKIEAMEIEHPGAVCLTEREWGDFMEDFPGFDMVSLPERWKIDGFYVVILARGIPSLFYSCDWDEAMKYQTEEYPNGY